MKFLLIAYTLFLHKKNSIKACSPFGHQDKELMIIHFKNHFKHNDLFISASHILIFYYLPYKNIYKNLNLSIHLAIKSIFKRKMEVIVDFFAIWAHDDFYNQTSACEISLLNKYLFLRIAFCAKYASHKSLHRENIKKSLRWHHLQTISFDYYDYTRHFNLLSRLKYLLYFLVLFNCNNVKIKHNACEISRKW